MNRRGFISLLTGAAGAALVPWRGDVEPLIFVPRRAVAFPYDGTFSNVLYPEATLTQLSLEGMIAALRRVTYGPIRIQPTQLVVSSSVKRLIDTDPVVRRAAESVLGRRL